jgi:hypothetical protein
MAGFALTVAGPSYHLWFNFLDQLPILVWNARRRQQKLRIKEAAYLLRTHNIYVGEFMVSPRLYLLVERHLCWQGMPLLQYPDVPKMSPNMEKLAKVAADQLVFSPIYTLIFFMTIGTLNALAGVNDQDERDGDGEPGRGPSSPATSTTSANSASSSAPGTGVTASSSASVSSGAGAAIAALRSTAAVNARDTSLAAPLQTNFSTRLKDALAGAWVHTKNVFLSTYIIDCLVWPPGQVRGVV